MTKRNWQDSLQKVEEQPYCRVCGSPFVEQAHVIGRARDERRGGVRYVNPDSIVPLCAEHHRAYDGRRLDLLPYLTVAEQARAVIDADGIEAARRRIVGRAA